MSDNQSEISIQMTNTQDDSELILSKNTHPGYNSRTSTVDRQTIKLPPAIISKTP